MSNSIRTNLAKNRQKWLSEQLYQEGEEEELQEGERIKTVRILREPSNRVRIEETPTSYLWKWRGEESQAIPCLYFQSPYSPAKLLLYFHGNGEDLAGCHHFLKNISNYTQTSVLAVEYPGYSLYEGAASSEAIEADSRQVVEFLQSGVGFRLEDIMVVGRSIGSGPALYVASLYKVAGLVLLSPFLSLCEAVQDLYGTIPAALLKQRFDNKRRAKDVESPCLIVHGTKDRLISEKHTRELSQYFRGYCGVRIVKEMSHSVFEHEEFFALVNEFQLAIGYAQ